MDTIKHVRYLSGIVGPKYKKRIFTCIRCFGNAQKNLWDKKLNKN